MSTPSWDDIDRALGIAGDDLVGYFREAGFEEPDAQRGARMAATGRYFTFTEVATDLATGGVMSGTGSLSPIQESKIAAVAAKINAEAAAKGPTRTPWGRALSEAGVPTERDAWGRARPVRPRTPTVEDFTAVGLSEADANKAAAGLAKGTYISFEDACLSAAIFGESKNFTLNEAAMREKAREFTKAGS